jgi:hypothetical protein
MSDGTASHESASDLAVSIVVTACAGPGFALLCGRPDG